MPASTTAPRIEFRPNHGPLSPGYRICKTTVMDTSDPGLRFDDAGNCHFVRSFDDRRSREVVDGATGRANFQAMANRIRRSSGPDCICGVSGGADSSLVLLRAVQAGLKPLAVHVDNGWDEELAISNIERLTSTLGVELHTEVLDWDEFRDLQRSFFLASVPNVEMATDHAIVAALFRVASKLGLPYILSGSNYSTEGFLPTNASYQNKDWYHIRSLQKQFGKVPLRTYPHLSKAGFAWHVLARGVRFLPVLDQLDYDREAAKCELANALGWRDYGRKHGESKFTRFFQEHYLPTKFGIDKRRAHLSCQILSGSITRQHALEELSKPMWTGDELLQAQEYVCRKLQFTPEAWASVMAERPKSHFEYPTDPFFRYSDGVLFRAFRLIATGRRQHKATVPLVNA
jgi:N-acetyl sugar amidotransferase